MYEGGRRRWEVGAKLILKCNDIIAADVFVTFRHNMSTSVSSGSDNDSHKDGQ